MMPVRPPAASASSSTAGNQKRRSRCFRSSGGAFTIAVGLYALRRSKGGFAAIFLHLFTPTMPKDARFGQRGFPQLATFVRFPAKIIAYAQRQRRLRERRIRGLLS